MEPIDPENMTSREKREAEQIENAMKFLDALAAYDNDKRPHKLFLRKIGIDDLKIGFWIIGMRSTLKIYKNVILSTLELPIAILLAPFYDIWVWSKKQK